MGITVRPRSTSKAAREATTSGGAAAVPDMTGWTFTKAGLSALLRLLRSERHGMPTLDPNSCTRQHAYHTVGLGASPHVRSTPRCEIQARSRELTGDHRNFI